MTISPKGPPGTIGQALRAAREERAWFRRRRKLLRDFVLTVAICGGLVWAVATLAHWAARP